jgi:putative transcriptional regulator
MVSGCYIQAGPTTSKRAGFIYIIMPIIVNIDVMLAKRKMQSKELAERLGITQANLSILKTGKAKGIRFDTLEAICKILNCQPADILEYKEE